MKLTSNQIEQTLKQIEAEALPESHPAVSQLNRVFGDHTFFVDDAGLNIVEPAEPTDSGALSASVIKLASWSVAAHTTLTPHEPELTDVVIELGWEAEH